MTIKPKAPSGILVLMKFFGRLPEQSLKDFKAEVDCLTTADKTELVDLIKAETGA